MNIEEAIKLLTRLINKSTDGYEVQALNMAIQALKSLDKLDEIITEQIDISYDQVECQTLRWVLDKISEVEVSEKNEM
jgi:hypothetical protein